MVSVKSSLLAIAAAAFVSADYSINPDSVSSSTRESWCQSELSTCPIICNQISSGQPKANTCDTDTLTYGCVCSNNLLPNVSEYSLTLPYFICQEWGNQCVAGCGQDNICASDCRQNHPCGALDPKRENVTTTTTSASATGSATSTSTDAIYTGLGDGTGTSSSNKDSAAPPVLKMGGIYSLLVTGGTLIAGVALML